MKKKPQPSLLFPHHPQLFQQALLDWFDQYGRKHLPWQQHKTPYRVWISEIMLQQTQVSTVISYFDRFMKSFPDLSSLAEAHEDEVLHQWTGLGYYSRARNLYCTAKIISQEKAGIFPDTLPVLLSLPGIGLSTAGAILAIAFNQPATILDGNVKRVLARFYGITQAINEKKTENKLWELATSLTPTHRVADYTQAMMDLGATVCTRTKPHCDRCPLIRSCAAHRQKITSLIPVKKAPRQIPTRQTTFLVFKKGNAIWLHKRPAKGIWASLFSFPEIAGQATPAQIRAFCQEYFQFSLTDYHQLDVFRHTFTHYHLDIFPILINCKKTPQGMPSSQQSRKMEASQQIWYKLNKPSMIGLPKPVLSILKGLQ